MNPDAVPKSAKTKYSPTHSVSITLQVKTNKNPEQLAEVIRQRSCTIDGVSSALLLNAEVVKLP